MWLLLAPFRTFTQEVWCWQKPKLPEETLHMSLADRPRSCLASNVPGQMPGMWVRKQSWKWTFQFQLFQLPAVWVTSRCLCLPGWDPSIETDKSHPHCAFSEFLTYRIFGYNKNLLVYSNQFQVDLILSSITGLEKLFVSSYKSLYNLASAYLFDISSNLLLAPYIGTNQVLFSDPPIDQCFFTH